jgi:18S rRNA (guanine1575-N7)-methyltransferase
MAKGSRCVFQFYPENPAQVEMIVGSAMKAGFGGGLVVDYPNSTKAKKYYLVLFAGVSSVPELPKGLEEEENGVAYSRNTIRQRKSKSKKKVKDKSWVLKKKESRRKKGIPTPSDSKYTARKRGPRF